MLVTDAKNTAQVLADFTNRPCTQACCETLFEESSVLSSPNLFASIWACFSSSIDSIDIQIIGRLCLIIIDNDEFVDAFEHFEEIHLQARDVLHHAHNLNDLLIAQEKEPGEVLALRFQVLDEALHEVLKHLHHEWNILPQTLSLAELLIRLASAFSVIYLLTVNPIYGHELFVLLRHVMCYVPLSKNW